MNSVLGHDSVLLDYTRLGKTWATEMNFVMNHGLGAGSIARPVDQKSTRYLVMKDHSIFSYLYILQ